MSRRETLGSHSKTYVNRLDHAPHYLVDSQIFNTIHSISNNKLRSEYDVIGQIGSGAQGQVNDSSTIFHTQQGDVG